MAVVVDIVIDYKRSLCGQPSADGNQLADLCREDVCRVDVGRQRKEQRQKFEHLLKPVEASAFRSLKIPKFHYRPGYIYYDIIK